MAANLHAPRFAHITGWGMAVPERVLTNVDLEAIIDTSDSWIQERTGIRQRRIAADNESTATLGLTAARNALEVANILPTDIDLIIVATSTPEHLFPSTASLIQDRLGALSAGAFDLSAACTGFIYAMNMAAQSIISGSIDTALVVGSETMSRLLSWDDRSTAILFGDGAGAVILQAREVPGGVMSSVLRSDGSGSDLLHAPAVGAMEAGEQPFHVNGNMHRITMNGREVFRFATKVIKDSVLEAVEKAGWTLEEVDWIVPHQANQRIIDRAAKNLNIPTERFVSNLASYGNTSAASIPIALCEAHASGQIQPDQKLVIVGFGAGLAWGAMTINWGVTDAEQPFAGRFRREVLYLFASIRSDLSRTLRRMSNRLVRSPLRPFFKWLAEITEESNKKGPSS